MFSKTPKSPNIIRRTFIKELDLAIAGTLSLLNSQTSAQKPTDINGDTKPNILLIMTDQQRWDAMSYSGNWVQTPNMDKIADTGYRTSLFGKTQNPGIHPNHTQICTTRIVCRFQCQE